jgi:hypothetical protein
VAGPPAGYAITDIMQCGQSLGIPTSPVETNVAYGFDNDYVRLWTLGFVPGTFEDPTDSMDGVIVVAWWGKVWLYDTARPALGWLQLADQTPPTGVQIHPFGRTFTLTGTTLTCTGTNRDGAMSSFTVTIDRDAGSYAAAVSWATSPLPVVTGSELTQVYNATWTNTVEESVSSSLLPASYAGGTIGDPDGWAVVQENVERTLASAYTASLVGGYGDDPGVDPFVGGPYNPFTAASGGLLATLRVDETPQNSRLEVFDTLDLIVDPPATEDLVFAVCDYRYVATHRIVREGTDAGTVVFDYTYDVTKAYSHITGLTETVNLDEATIPVEGSIVPKPKYEYSAIDHMLHKYAWRREQYRLGSWVHPALSDPAGKHAEGTAVVSISAATFKLNLVNASLSPLVSLDLLTKFGVTIKDAPAYTTGFAYTFNDLPRTVLTYGRGPSLLFEPVNAGDVVALSSPPRTLGLWFPRYLIKFNPNPAQSGPDWPFDEGEADNPETTTYGFAGGFLTTSIPQTRWSIRPYADAANPDARPFTTNGQWGDWRGTYNVTYDGAASWTPAAYAAMGSIETVGAFSPADPPGQWRTQPGNTTPYFDEIERGAIMPELEAHYGELYQVTPRYADVYQMDDRIYLDPRSDGFFAQYFTEGRQNIPDGFPYVIKAALDTYIGNDDSVTTLQAVLDELAAMSSAPVEDNRKVFIRPEYDRLVSLV